MRHARLVLPIAILVAIALFAGPRVGAASITSSVLIDPVGEYTGDVFGCSVAWIGDVNGDGYEDLLIGAFRYPEIASAGKVYLYFGGPTLDPVADLVINPLAGGAGWFGVSVASAGDFNGDDYPDFIIGEGESGPGRSTPAWRDGRTRSIGASQPGPSTSRSFRPSASDVNGLCRNTVSESRTACCAMASSVYPET